MKKIKKIDTETNNYFLLKCMAALSAAAIVAASIYAIVAAKASAAATIGLAATSIGGPIIGLITGIGALALLVAAAAFLPLCFSRSRVSYGTPFMSSLFIPTNNTVFVPATTISTGMGGGVVHRRGDFGGNMGNTHGHPAFFPSSGGGRMGGTTHGHGGASIPSGPSHPVGGRHGHP